MLNKLLSIGKLIGNTPVWETAVNNIDLFAKLEYYNYTGSIKDRPAYNIIYNAIRKGEITGGSYVIESSSGNFAIAMATICAYLGLKFIAVIDPNINKAYEKQLNLICYKVIKVTVQDETGGYLLTRLDAVKSFCQKNENAYWTNQYENPDNYLSYYNGLGVEICNTFQQLDYAFVGVSTCGTIAGLSKRLKAHFPAIRIIAVDIAGSVIFGGPPQKRHIAGIGASIVPPMLAQAYIDEIMYITEPEVVDGCEALLKDHCIFGGASIGAVYSGILKYFEGKQFSVRPNVLFLCTDKGNAYLDNVYDVQWKNNLLEELAKNNISDTYVIST